MKLIVFAMYGCFFFVVLGFFLGGGGGVGGWEVD